MDDAGRQRPQAVVVKLETVSAGIVPPRRPALKMRGECIARAFQIAAQEVQQPQYFPANPRLPPYAKSKVR